MLDEVFRDVDQRFFQGRLAAQGVEIGWSSKPLTSRWAVWKPAKALIEVNRLLADDGVPREVVEFEVFHEGLHVVFPRVSHTHHTPEFREAERTFPGFDQVQAWLSARGEGALVDEAARGLDRYGRRYGLSSADAGKVVTTPTGRQARLIGWMQGDVAFEDVATGERFVISAKGAAVLVARMHSNPEEQRPFRIVCAWCKTYMRGPTVEEDPGARVSHGICEACMRKQLEEAGIQANPIDPELRDLERELGPRHPRVVQARRRAGLEVDWPRVGDTVRVYWYGAEHPNAGSGLAVVEPTHDSLMRRMGLVAVRSASDGFLSHHSPRDMEPVESAPPPPESLPCSCVVEGSANCPVHSARWNNPRRRGKPFTTRKPRASSSAHALPESRETCVFCGQPALFDVLEYYPELREFELDYCCEGNRDDWVSQMRDWSPETWARYWAERTGIDVRSVGGDPERRYELGIGPESEWLVDRGITLVRSQPIKDRLRGRAAPGALSRDELREYVRLVHQHAPDPNAGMLWGYAIFNGPPGDPEYDGKPRFSSKKDGVRPLNLVRWPGTLIGVALVGRPVAPHLDVLAKRTGQKGEKVADVTRLALDHRLPAFITYKAASEVYVQAWRDACAMGYARVQTFTLASEKGMSLRYARYKPVGTTVGGQASRPSRSRAQRSETLAQGKVKWERRCS